ncbi:MAG TPA: hypothetical protein VF039_03330 [Longimicrobiales bacterium]
MSDRFAHVAAVIGGVVAAALRDAGRARVVVVDHTPPESALLIRLLERAQPTLPVVRVDGDDIDDARTRARREANGDGLLADPVNKTVALLFPELLAEPLLPLADLYATQVRELAGDWSAPAAARELISGCGGIETVDAFLVAHLDQRRGLDAALTAIPHVAARTALRERFLAGWWWRRRAGVVPKLGARTLGIDLR